MSNSGGGPCGPGREPGGPAARPAVPAYVQDDPGPTAWLYLKLEEGGGEGAGALGVAEDAADDTPEDDDREVAQDVDVEEVGGVLTAAAPPSPTSLASRVRRLLSSPWPSAPAGRFEVLATACGVVVALWRPRDAEAILEAGEAATGPASLAATLGESRLRITPIGRSKQAVLLRGVPTAIPLQDIEAALARQGVTARSVQRLRHLVRVELRDSSQRSALLRAGLDFFGAVRFVAVADRTLEPLGPRAPVEASDATPATARPPSGTTTGAELVEPAEDPVEDNVLQCYRCQGFWHVSVNCRHLPRCVRCGEPHAVAVCPRPRSDPVCCHCAGPHHAAFRQCPVRRQLANAVPITITMSSARLPDDPLADLW